MAPMIPQGRSGASTHAVIIQRSVGRHSANIVAVEQPIDLFASQRHHLLLGPRPVERFLDQALVIEDEAVVLPQQALDLVPLPIGEGIKGAIERAASQFQLHECG